MRHSLPQTHNRVSEKHLTVSPSPSLLTTTTTPALDTGSYDQALLR